jgi:ketosteroid isomerase-like protein
MLSAVTAAPATTEAHEFASRFVAAWARPSIDGFCAILAPDVRLVQPLAPTIVGHAAFRKQFGQLFELIPDLHGEVTGHTADGNVIHIDMTLRGTLAGKPIEWDLCDRITLADGLVAERISYFDPLPLLTAIATRPRAWLPSLRHLAPVLRRG